MHKVNKRPSNRQGLLLMFRKIIKEANKKRKAVDLECKR